MNQKSRIEHNKIPYTENQDTESQYINNTNKDLKEEEEKIYKKRNNFLHFK